ncbi:hypothetical protein HK104_009321 [Borealophlyctis nickersoniae]|nr:hypothetical protein HK104_009321 [Borealophlyctis nickersoniae]
MSTPTTTFKGYAAFEKGGPLKPFEFEPPPLGDHDIQVAIHYCGICFSDIHTLDSGWGKTPYPIVVGHEIVGVIEQMGELVPKTKYKVGDRVGVGPQISACMRDDCSMCSRGFEQCCPRKVFAYGEVDMDSSMRHGGYSNRIRARYNFVFHIPETLSSPEAAPLLCAGVTTYAPLKRCGVAHNMKVGVIGIGGLGHLGLQFAHELGAHVTAISHSPHKKDECLRLGAHAFITPTDFPHYKTTFDLILCTANVHDQDWGTYLSLLDVNGKFILVAIPEGNLSIPPMALIKTQLALVGSLIGSPKETRETLDFAGEKGVKPMVEVMPVEKVNEAIERVRKGDVKYRIVLDIEHGKF